MSLYAEFALKKGRIAMVTRKGQRGTSFERFLSDCPFRFLRRDEIVGINHRWITSPDQLFSALLLEG